MIAEMLEPVCAHCYERIGGAEGTIWCAECLEWYRMEYMKELALTAGSGDAWGEK